MKVDNYALQGMPKKNWLNQIAKKGRVYISKKTLDSIGYEGRLPSFLERNNLEIKPFGKDLHYIQMKIIF